MLDKRDSIKGLTLGCVEILDLVVLFLVTLLVVFKTLVMASILYETRLV